MGAILRWKLPDLREVTYDKVVIYRSTNENGPFSEIATQPIEDNTYFDIDGSTGHYYKVRFLNTSDGKYSDYSNILRCGDFAVLVPIDEVRSSLNIPDSVPDKAIFYAIEAAQAHLSRDISIPITEKIQYISDDKQNIIDGENRLFYVAKPYIGDLDEDGSIDGTDVQVYYIENGARKYVQVSSVNAAAGSFEVAEPLMPGKDYYVHYFSCNAILDPPEAIVKSACIPLVGYYLTRYEPIRSFRVGNVSVTREMPQAMQYRMEYRELAAKIKRVAKHSTADITM